MKDTVNRFDKCFEIAKQYNSLTEWQERNGHSYAVARRNNWHREIGRKLGWNMGRYGYWTYDRCKETASSFSSITEWQIHHGASYTTAYRHGWVREIASSLGWSVRVTRPKGYWTYERLLESASNYSSPVEWKRGAYSAYIAAGNANLREKIYKELGWVLKKSNARRAVNQ